MNRERPEQDRQIDFFIKLNRTKIRDLYTDSLRLIYGLLERMDVFEQGEFERRLIFWRRRKYFSFSFRNPLERSLEDIDLPRKKNLKSYLMRLLSSQEPKAKLEGLISEIERINNHLVSKLRTLEPYPDAKLISKLEEKFETLRYAFLAYFLDIGVSENLRQDNNDDPKAIKMINRSDSKSKKYNHKKIVKSLRDYLKHLIELPKRARKGTVFKVF